MPRHSRPDFAGIPVHVVNRSARRLELFSNAYDYAAFMRVLGETLRLHPMRLLAFCVMPNHWHFVLWPRSTAELSAFMKRLTEVHAMRWRRARDAVGEGAVYQSRYKVFPVSTDEYLSIVCRYVERNALTAGLVNRAEDWPWGSLHLRIEGDPESWLNPGPIALCPDWVDWVNEVVTAKELERLRACSARGTPFGPPNWVNETVSRLGLEHTTRPTGRPAG